MTPLDILDSAVAHGAHVRWWQEEQKWGAEISWTVKGETACRIMARAESQDQAFSVLSDLTVYHGGRSLFGESVVVAR